jgi:MFS family permease
VYSLTGDVLDLGWLGLAQFLPFVPLVLLAGHAADSFSRQWIIALCYGLELVCALLLIALSRDPQVDVGAIFAVMALHGSARAFLMPANQAVLRDLVQRDDFERAVAISSSAFQIGVIAGPAIGGLLYLAGPAAVYVSAGTLLGIAIILIAGTRPRHTRRPGGPLSLERLLGGVRHVRSRPVILGAISLDLFAVLFGGATALLPAYANDVLGVGPAELGLLRTAMALGAAGTGLLLTFKPITRHVGRCMFAGVALYGTATLGLGLSADFRLSLLALGLMGAGDMIGVYVRHTLIQLDTPDAIRGRVSAVNSVFIGASNELGEFESGLTAAWFGLVPAILIGGTATLLVVGLWVWKFPALRSMDRFPRDITRSAQP